MIVSFDYFNKVQKPRLFIENPNGTTLSVVSNFDELKTEFTFNAVSSPSLKVYKYIDGVETDCYKYICLYRYIYIENIGHFVITGVDEVINGFDTYRTVSLTSCEMELNNRSVVILEGVYPLYDESGTVDDIMSEILSLFPTWSLGHVDIGAAITYRSFEKVESGCYEFMANTLQELYGVLFDFDIENRVVNIYDKNNLIQSSGIFISKKNVINSIKFKTQSEDIVTAIHVKGSDDRISIEGVNPTGSSTIYVFDYFKDWMSTGLSSAINTWESKIETNKTTFENLTTQHDELSAQIWLLEEQIIALRSEIDALKTAIANLKSAGSSYSDKEAELSQKVSELGNKLSSLSSKKTQLAPITTSRNTLQQSLAIQNNFTSAQLSELNYYIHEGNYDDSVLVVTDSMSITDIQNQCKELYNKALYATKLLTTPRNEFSIDCANFLCLIDFKQYINNLALGKTIDVEIEDGNIQSLILLKFTFDHTSDSLTLEFGNRTRLKSSIMSYNEFYGESEKSISSLRNDVVLNSSAIQSITGSVNNTNSNLAESVTNLADGLIATKVVVADKVDTQQLNAVNGKILSLETKDAEITGTLDVVNSNIEQANIDIANINTVVAGKISFGELAGELAKINSLESNSAFITYLNTMYLLANQAGFTELSALVANIKNAIIGTSTTETGIVINLTSENAVIDSLLVKNQISNQINVSDLQAGNITLSDNMQIVSDTGKLSMNGSLLQVIGTDSSGQDYVAIQLGYDATNNPSLIIRNENGATIISPTGVTKDAIADDLIENRMIGNNQISKDKLSFNVNVDDNGDTTTTMENIYMNNGTKFGVEYTQFKEGTENSISSMQSTVDTVSGQISDKVSKTQTITVENPDGTSAQKTLINALTESIQDVNSISNTVSSLSTTVDENHTEVTQSITEQKQTSDSFYQGVRKSYLLSKYGSINILKDSGVQIESDQSLIDDYLLYEPLLQDTEYTVIFKGMANDGHKIGVSIDDGVTYLKQIDVTTTSSIYISTITTPTTEISTQVTFSFYNIGSSSPLSSKIEWCGLFKGNIVNELSSVTEWIPSPQEDDIQPYDLGTSFQQSAESIVLRANDELKDEVNASIEIAKHSITNQVKNYITNKPIKYIRDYLNGNNLIQDNQWIGIAVYSNGVNLLEDESKYSEILEVNPNRVNVYPKLKCVVSDTGEIDDEGNPIILSDVDVLENPLYQPLNDYLRPLVNMQVDTENTSNIDTNLYIQADYNTQYPQGCYVEVEFKEVQTSIDTIKIWHSRDNTLEDEIENIWNHKLMVSEDGVNWENLFDSEILHGYEESINGKTHYISSLSMNNQLSSIEQFADSILMTVKKEYVSKNGEEDNYATIKEIIENSFIQDENGWLFNFNNTYINVDDNTKESISNWIQLSAGKIKLATGQNQAALELSNEEIQFTAGNGLKAATIGSTSLEIERGTIKKDLVVEYGGTLTIGNFKLIPRPNLSNVSIVKKNN